MYYVYILELYGGKRYIGFTTNLKSRIVEHRLRPTQTTKTYPPKRLLFYCALREKQVALAFERYLKSSTGCAFRKKHFKF